MAKAKTKSWSATALETGVFKYYAADGQFKYEKRRKIDKDGEKSFYFMHPVGGGRLKAGRGGAAVLFNLPDVASTQPGDVIWWAEGEKDICTLAELGFVATCNDDGAGKKKFKKSYAPWFEGRTVYVLFDNDQPGFELRDDVVEHLTGVAELVCTVALPEVGHKEDVTDWIQKYGGTKAKLLQLAEVAAKEARMKPRQGDAFEPADDRLQEVPPAAGDDEEEKDPHDWRPFPLEHYPPLLREYALAAAESINCDPVMVALHQLPVFSALVGNSRVVQIKENWSEPLLVWATVVATPSSGKSPALKAAIAPAEAVDRNLEKAYEAALKEYRSELKAYLRPSRKSPGDFRSKEDPEAPEEPKPEQLIVDDCTVESLAKEGSRNRHGLLLVKDELASWYQSFARYRQNGGSGPKDETFWCSTFNTWSIVVNRKTTSGALRVARMYTSVTGSIQPEVLRGFATSTFFESGLASRFLFAMPPKRLRLMSHAHVNPELLKRYVKLGTDIYFDSRAYLAKNDGAPESIPFQPPALEAFFSFCNELAHLQYSSSGALSYAIPKLQQYAARLAGLFAICQAIDSQTPASVGSDHIIAAIHLVKWFMAETPRVYRVLLGFKPLKDRAKVLDFIAKSGGRVTARDVSHNFFSRFPTAAAAKTFLAELAADGLGVMEAIPPGPKGGRATEVFQLTAQASQEVNHAATA